MSLSKPLANAQSAFLGLGSNLGDRCRILAQAAERLDRDPQIQVVSGSSFYATEPVDLPDQPEFVNAAIEILTTRKPEALLDVCLAIEAALGRVRSAERSSRTLDIDILLYGTRRLKTDRLCVPHQRMAERAFVLVPLVEIAPDALLDGQTIAARALGVSQAGIRRLDIPPPWPPARRGAIWPLSSPQG